MSCPWEKLEEKVEMVEIGDMDEGSFSKGSSAIRPSRDLLASFLGLRLPGLSNFLSLSGISSSKMGVVL